MFIFWLIAVLFCLLSIAGWRFLKYGHWAVPGTSAGVALALAGIFHFGSFMSATADTQTLSGQITVARYIPSWVEYYEYAVYRTEYYTESYTDSKGNSRTRTCSRQVFDHWEPTSEVHPDEWSKTDSFDRPFEIERPEFSQICRQFGSTRQVAGERSTMRHNSHMLSGNPNDTLAINVTGFVLPVTKTEGWTNKVKAARSVFSFPEVPAGTPVFDYVVEEQPFQSHRLYGQATSAVSISEWDKLNARLGPSKKVNLLLVGFGAGGTELAELQRTKWKGGKKNDLVICYGGAADAHHATWAKVFGWTDENVLKYDLATIVRDHPVDDQLLPLIEQKVREAYRLKNWKDFDYLSVEPTTREVVAYLLISLALQLVIWIVGAWIAWRFDGQNSFYRPWLGWRGEIGRVVQLLKGPGCPKSLAEPSSPSDTPTTRRRLVEALLNGGGYFSRRN